MQNNIHSLAGFSFTENLLESTSSFANPGGNSNPQELAISTRKPDQICSPSNQASAVVRLYFFCLPNGTNGYEWIGSAKCVSHHWLP